MRKLEFCTFEIKYSKEILEIADKEIGLNFINQHYLDFFIENENARGIVALEDNNVVGFSFFLWCFPAELSKYVFVDESWIRTHFEKSTLIGYRGLIAVKQHYQNKGIGEQLIALSMKVLKKRSDKIVSVVWKKKSRDIGNVLISYGMKPVKLIHEYWKENSLIRKYECAVCGPAPCLCTAEIYISGD